MIEWLQDPEPLEKHPVVVIRTETIYSLVCYDCGFEFYGAEDTFCPQCGSGDAKEIGRMDWDLTLDTEDGELEVERVKKV